MSLNDQALRAIPDVAVIRNMSDLRKARALVRFRNGRELLVTWEARAQRFEVEDWVKTDLGTSGKIEPFQDIEHVIEYLSMRSCRVLEDGVDCLPLEAAVEARMHKARF